MKTWKHGSLFPLFFFALSCAHYPDVHPMSSGIHKVSLSTERKTDGFREAFSQAQSYCKDVSRTHAVQVNETSEYIGTLDEVLYNAAKTASEVAMAIGATGAIVGGKEEQEVGSVAAVGGGIADNALGSGYQYTLEFRCQ